MGKGPEIGIVGNASREEKHLMKGDFEEALFDHFSSFNDKDIELLKEELPKSEKELACVDFANNETNRLMIRFGLKPYNIPRENYHVLPEEIYRKLFGAESLARAYSQKQGLMFCSPRIRNNPIFLVRQPYMKLCI